jgi:hypothetical protein
MFEYEYNKLTDIDSSKLYLVRLSDEIKNSSITSILHGIYTNGNDISIAFNTELHPQELEELNYLVKTHSGEPYPAEDEAPNLDIGSDGRQVVRTAATFKGWHYQAHSVQFEVNKLDSIYNKDDEGNDLGYSSLKIYDANGVECVDQNTADTLGVKTVLSWKPDFDFEIISGNIRQLEKETIDSYLYTNAKVYTGYPAPYDFLKVPFVQGGINLKYIGADEPLKTDGRASKLFKSTNGDHFEVVVNYENNLITNENRHKMSIIFEIYKDPTS